MVTIPLAQPSRVDHQTERRIMPRHIAFQLSVLTTIALMGACAQSPMSSVTAPSALGGEAATAASPGADVNRQLAEVRATVAGYHNLDKALADGFVPISECVELAGVGGMGFHYGQVPFDNAVDYARPEALVYAPQNGRLALAAVEYIIPQALWTSADPPSLFGREFHKNDALGIWALHAWVFKHNPAGLFEDWNPTVSCAE
jgi:hypothetical protein